MKFYHSGQWEMWYRFFLLLEAELQRNGNSAICNEQWSEWKSMHSYIPFHIPILQPILPLCALQHCVKAVAVQELGTFLITPIKQLAGTMQPPFCSCRVVWLKLSSLQDLGMFALLQDKEKRGPCLLASKRSKGLAEVILLANGTKGMLWGFRRKEEDRSLPVAFF